MPFDKFDWTKLSAVSSPQDSTNPVLRLQLRDGTVAWLKAAPGGQRVAFAGAVHRRIGFAKQGVILVRENEVDAVFYRITGLAGQAEKIKLDEMRSRVRRGEDLILLEDVGGNGTFANQYSGIKEGNDIADFYAKIMSHGQAQDDLARMIAADLLLGNFDRVSTRPNYSGKMMTPQFHTGNFIYDATRHGFLPIDNDTVAPSLKHIAAVNDKPPTQNDLYRTVILGGALAFETATAFPSPFQGSMSELLGDEAADRIAEILTDKLGGWEGWDPAKFGVLKGIAEQIAPKVRTAMSTLVQELKKPSDTEASLLKTMKACQNVEGMNYSVFKVKSRFAKLMTEGHSTQDSLSYALAYGAYRDWKDALAEIAARPVPTYAVPVAPVLKHDTKTKFKRGLNTVVARTPLVDRDKDIEDAKKLANEIKKSLRSNKQDYEQLKATYEQIRMAPDTDARIIKAKIFIIATLVMYEMQQILKLLEDVNARKREDVVAAMYRKSLVKLNVELVRTLGAYKMIVEKIDAQVRLKAIKDADLPHIGFGRSRELPELLQACEQQLNLLKTC